MNIQFAFNSTPIRISAEAGSTYFALRDVCAAIGYSYAAGADLVRRNPEDFPSSMIIRVTRTIISPKSGGQLVVSEKVRGRHNTDNVTFLNEEDTIGLLMMLSVSRISDPERRAKVRAFRAWAKKVIVDVIHGRIPEPLLDRSITHLLSLPASDRNAQIRLLSAQFGLGVNVIRSRLVNAKVAIEKYGYGPAAFGLDLRLAPLTPAQILEVPAIKECLRAGHGEKASAYAKAAQELGLHEVTTRKAVLAAKNGRKLPRQGHSARVLRRIITGDSK